MSLFSLTMRGSSTYPCPGVWPRSLALAVETAASQTKSAFADWVIVRRSRAQEDKATEPNLARIGPQNILADRTSPRRRASFVQPAVLTAGPYPPYSPYPPPGPTCAAPAERAYLPRPLPSSHRLPRLGRQYLHRRSHDHAVDSPRAYGQYIRPRDDLFEINASLPANTRAF